MSILAFDMTPVQLAGGIWRQCLIRPGDGAAPDGPDQFAISAIDAPCCSVAFLVALIGHQPRDIATYLVDLKQRDPEMFKLILAKDFKAAVAKDPDIVERPWLKSACRLWREKKDDYLPPFLAAVLFAEMARLAQNQSGLLALAFDQGTELTINRFLARADVSGGFGASRAVDHAIAYASHQTVALSPPPDLMVANKDAEGIAEWAETGAASLALATGLRGSLEITPKEPTEARAIRACYEAHPHFWKDARKGKGHSRQPYHAATFWGLNWRQNAAVGLLEIALTAREWNERYRPNGPRLPKLSEKTKARNVARAIATISFRWVAEHCGKAGKTVLGTMLSKEDKEEQNFDPWSSDAVDPLTIDNHLGDQSGMTLLQDAWKRISKRPTPGKLGYTARSRAHLWIDDEGDDIDHYIRFQKQALRRHDEAVAGTLPIKLQDPARVPMEIAALLGRQHGVKARRSKRRRGKGAISMTTDAAAARGAQQYALSISSLSIDPMLARSMRDTK